MTSGSSGSSPLQNQERIGFVLAGGQSSRMGTDKALMRLAGRPLVEHSLDILRIAGFKASIAGARTPELARFAPVIADTRPDCGPLAGICAALASTSAPLAVFLSVDAPFIPPSLLVYMVQHAVIARTAVTLASINGFAQTFPVVIDRHCLPALEQSLLSGPAGCFSAFKTASGDLASPLAVLPIERLIQSGQIAHRAAHPAYQWFLNINTSDDLRYAESLLHGSKRVI